MGYWLRSSNSLASGMSFSKREMVCCTALSFFRVCPTLSCGEPIELRELVCSDSHAAM